LENPEAQERLANRIVAEGLSVRTVEEIVAVGAEDSSSRRSARTGTKPPIAPGLRHLADRLSDLFETRVKVELGQRKGKIVVEFASIDDLERIVKVMNPAASAQESAE
jgi:ParB family chromosome partitioning protein